MKIIRPSSFEFVDLGCVFFVLAFWTLVCAYFIRFAYLGPLLLILVGATLGFCFGCIPFPVKMQKLVCLSTACSFYLGIGIQAGPHPGIVFAVFVFVVLFFLTFLLGVKTQMLADLG